MVVIRDVTDECSVGVKVSNEESEEVLVNNTIISESSIDVTSGNEDSENDENALRDDSDEEIEIDTVYYDGSVDSGEDSIADTSDGDDDDDDDDDDVLNVEDTIVYDSGEDDEDDDDDVGDDDDDDGDSEEELEEAQEVKSEEQENDTRQLGGNDVVENVLAREAEALKAISVSKPLELKYDLGTLLAVDSNDLDFTALRKSKEKYLHKLARDNTQLLINQIWQLRIARHNTDILAELPAPTSKLPREKPVPKPKTPTKWELFAAKKGIIKTKKKRVQWDETLQKWVPWWGYRKVQAEKEKDWAIEVRGNEDPYEDPYAKKTAAKKERIAKNEYQRLKNLAVDKSVKVPRRIEDHKTKVPSKELPKMGLLTGEFMNSKELRRAVTLSKASTGSLGNFQEKLPKEKVAFNLKSLMPMAPKKRKRMLTPNEEKTLLLDTFSTVQKKPKLNVDKAVNREIHEQQRRSSEDKKSGKSKGKRGKGNTKNKLGRHISASKSKGKGGKSSGKGLGKFSRGRKK